MNGESLPLRREANRLGRRGHPVLPTHAPGMRIGLFGGTFDPPHAAHRAACLLAMRRIGLDRVWWLVTPGNPLKDTSGLAPLHERVAAARKLAQHARIDVTDSRSRSRQYLYVCDDQLSDPALSWGALCLDHGRRQFAQFPSLAALARHRAPGADRGRRPFGTESLLGGEHSGSSTGMGAAARIGRQDPAAASAAGLDLSARPQIAAVFDGFARRARSRAS